MMVQIIIVVDILIKCLSLRNNLLPCCWGGHRMDIECFFPPPLLFPHQGVATADLIHIFNLAHRMHFLTQPSHLSGLGLATLCCGFVVCGGCKVKGSSPRILNPDPPINKLTSFSCLSHHCPKNRHNIAYLKKIKI